jgi:ABC-2 type transport system ATP-binding protein
VTGERETGSGLALELRGVTRAFRTGLFRRRSDVLCGVDLALERGRTLGLVGPNGSGKTTLLRIATGVDVQSGGDVSVLGASPHDARTRQRIGYLPEDSPFPHELTAVEALDLLGSLQSAPKIPRKERLVRANALLERVGLGRHARTTLGRYSRGMLRRFGLAQAWFSEPDLVLLDEPTAGLDAEGFDVLAGFMAQAAERGTTVVIASHLASDLTDHADELAVLLGGRIAAKGTPGTLLGAEGRTQLELEGLDEQGLAKLRAWVEEQGGHVTAERPGTRGLMERYRSPPGSQSGSARSADER